MSDSIERRPLKSVARDICLLASIFLAALVAHRFYLGYSLLFTGDGPPLWELVALVGLTWFAAFLTLLWSGVFIGALWWARRRGLPRSILLWVPLCVITPFLVFQIEPMMLGARTRLSAFSEGEFLTFSAEARRQFSQANLDRVSFVRYDAEGREAGESSGVERVILDDLYAHDVLRPWRKEMLTLKCGPDSVEILQEVPLLGRIGLLIYDRDLEASQKDDVRATRFWLGKRRLTERVHYFITD